MIQQTTREIEEQQTSEPLRRPGFWNRCWASFIRMGVLMPTIAAALTGILYIVIPQPVQISLLWAVGITVVIWLMLALPCSSLITAEKVNPRSFGLLQSEMVLYEPYCNHPETANGSGSEVTEAFQYIKRNLCNADSLSWVLETGYITSWETMHHAKEAFMEIGPETVVIGEALGDRLCIKGSAIENSDILLRNLTQAIRVLAPSAASYFEESPSSFPVSNLAARTPPGATNDPPHSVHDSSKSTSTSNSPLLIVDDPAHLRAQARSILRQVRAALNRFIDDRWEGLVHTRNLLLATIAITGIAIYLLLVLAIVARAPVSSIIAGMVFYIVGAIAGLFGWLYRGSRIDTTVDDYGLSLARLIATPLLSGLAGLGGVVITLVLYTSLLVPKASSLPASPGSIFSLNPVLLVASALFGLFPSLVIGTLLQQSQHYVEDLTTVKPSNQGTY